MPQLIERLTVDFPDIKFVLSDDFVWKQSESTIFYKPLKTNEDCLTLLHELAHFQLNHQSYKYDIELLKKEVEAWSEVKNTLADRYEITIDELFIEATLDYYRNWLYKRSVCPRCQALGQQEASLIYHCIACNLKWKANSAKKTNLKRVTIDNK